MIIITFHAGMFITLERLALVVFAGFTFSTLGVFNTFQKFAFTIDTDFIVL